MKNQRFFIPVIFAAWLSISGAATPAMVTIPADTFDMGNGKAVTEGLDDELPVHEVTLSEYEMGNFPVTKSEWDTVRTWGLSNGYTDLPAAEGRGSDHPVTHVSWYDVVKWCNARSEKESYTAVYYTDTSHTTVYRTGEVDLTNSHVNWSTADGYRLPTEAEWEMAARGSYPEDGKRFPRADTINHANGNFVCSGASYDTSTCTLPWTHPDYSPAYDPLAEVPPYTLDPSDPDYYAEGPPYTSEIGEFPANGLNLYSMAGNVWEWCWDWYDEDYYDSSPSTDPRGPASPTTYRVLRGGSWDSVAFYARCSNRAMDGAKQPLHGFRVVRID